MDGMQPTDDVPHLCLINDIEPLINNSWSLNGVPNLYQVDDV